MATTGLPAHPGTNQQWHLTYLDIPTAHGVSTGRGITIAIIDSGVKPNENLQGALIDGVSFIAGDDSKGRQDEYGHGTAVASLIAATKTGTNPEGIAPDSKVLPIRVLDAQGRGNATNTAKGINWASAHGAKIINISSSGGPNVYMREAVEEAIRKGVIVIASSGNKPAQNIIGFPANIDGVVAVGATDQDGEIAEISTTGEKLSLAAPGVDLFGGASDAGQHLGTGTSGSAAIVSGVAALVWSRYPELSAQEVIHRMTATAVDKGPPGRDPQYGFGIVDPVAALTADVPPLHRPSAGPAQAPGTAAPPPAGTTSRTAVVTTATATTATIAAVLTLTVILLRRRRRNQPRHQTRDQDRGQTRDQAGSRTRDQTLDRTTRDQITPE